ncbi:MAG: FoF1 ATP synthase subunit delta/epsilon [Bacteroidales bacterium]
MFLEVISPEKILYKGEVGLVQMPGSLGSFEILENHAHMVALLDAGRTKVIDNLRNIAYLTLSAGVVHVKDNHITILTE